MTELLSDTQCVETTIIPSDEWHILRDLYRHSWPTYMVTYHMLQNYIKWERVPYPDIELNIITIKDGGQWRQHGTFVLEDKNKMCHNIYFNTLEPENSNLLPKLLSHFKVTPMCIMAAFPESMLQIVKTHVENKNPQNLCKIFRTTILYHLPRSKYQQLVPKPVLGFKVRSLTTENIKKMKTMWSNPGPGFKSFMRRTICSNITFGAFREQDNELVAWVMQLPAGTIGLYVGKSLDQLDSIAEYLVTLISISISHTGCEVTVTIDDECKSTRTLFEKLGFVAIDRLYWFETLEPYEHEDQNVEILNIEGSIIFV